MRARRDAALDRHSIRAHPPPLAAGLDLARQLDRAYLFCLFYQVAIRYRLQSERQIVAPNDTEEYYAIMASAWLISVQPKRQVISLKSWWPGGRAG
jgi:hypothetical protein